MKIFMIPESLVYQRRFTCWLSYSCERRKLDRFTSPQSSIQTQAHGDHEWNSHLDMSIRVKRLLNDLINCCWANFSHSKSIKCLPLSSVSPEFLDKYARISEPWSREFLWRTVTKAYAALSDTVMWGILGIISGTTSASKSYTCEGENRSDFHVLVRTSTVSRQANIFIPFRSHSTAMINVFLQ